MALTREEWGTIVKGLKSVYPYDNFIKDKDAFDMWYELLKDLDYKQLAAGTQKFMQTSSKIPTPADLRKASIVERDISEGEAWAMVSKAISRSGYYSNEEYEKLPIELQRSVGSPEQLKIWATGEDTNMEVVQSQVLRSYRQVKERNRENQLVNPKVAQLIQSTSNLLGGAK